ncbi:GIY-YIG nuclease family protein [Longimonas halophila]|uniref:GIY-YIG nuclease family protein n=1 Tax=Longimonas halophila TaxID=1469170 RepID=UPI001C3ECF15
MATPHALYILQSEAADRFYVGRSSNPERRLQHQHRIHRAVPPVASCLCGVVFHQAPGHRCRATG